MTTLRDELRARDNNYSALEQEYFRQTAGHLLATPEDSYTNRPAHLTRSATVLIGSYNSCSSLEKTLLSIEQSSFQQTCPNQLEIVVVDDGSTDGTRGIIASLDTDLRIKYVRQQHAGLNRAHNTGLMVAEGDVIIFSDADMVHTPYAIEELMKRHEVLDHVTLAGFRFDVDPFDTRINQSAIRERLHDLEPECDRDFRLSSPGRPDNLCRVTRDWKDFGYHKRIIMANGAGYDLPAMVVGAFFSLPREQYARMGGSEERLVGWGCEDSLIGARSIALGNYVIPVYAATSAHIAHPRRSPTEPAEFLANIALTHLILDEEFVTDQQLPNYRPRIVDYFEKRSGRSPRPPGPQALSSPLHTARAYARRGRHHAVLGHYAQALTCYDEALRCEPDSPSSCWWLLGRGKIYRELHEYELALNAFRECQHDQACNAWAHFESGLTYACLGQYDLARQAMIMAHQIDSAIFDPRWVLDTSSDDHKRRGNCHADQGYHHLAVTDFEMALIVDPQNCWAHFDRALSLRALGRHAEALQALRRTDELLHPEDTHRTWVHAELGKTYFDLGDYNRAKVHLEEALRRYDSNDRARRDLSRLHQHVEERHKLTYPQGVSRPRQDIAGWLSDSEADLLAAATLQAVHVSHPAKENGDLAIVEIGSYCGRSTVAIAQTLRSTGSDHVRFYAIDPHEAYAFGGNRYTYPILMENLRRDNLDSYVKVIVARSTTIAWEHPIGLLFIDGLHDYDNVAADFAHYWPYVIEQGLVAFHDYSLFCPDVQRFVDELLLAGSVDFCAQKDGLILVKKTPQDDGIDQVLSR